MIKSLRALVALAGALLVSSYLWGQVITGAEFHLWNPISPQPNSELDNGNMGVYVRVMFNKDYSLQASSIRIFVDDEMIHGNVKLKENNLISAVFTEPLKPGKHVVNIQVQSTTGYNYEPYEWTFYIKSPPQDTLQQKKPDPLVLGGDITAESRLTTLTGPGQNLRQEPPQTTQLSFNVHARNSQIELGAFGFYTSDESIYKKNFQSRNYFQVTAGWKGIKLTAGDMNPVFDRLILTGPRVKGAMASFRYKKIELKLLRGLLARELEGSRLVLGTNEQAPPNLQADSSYLVPGTYKRVITAARLQFQVFAPGNNIGFSVLKAKDDLNSIQYGIAPKDNIVAGFDIGLTGYDRKVLFNWGVAGSGFSSDISKGALTKAQIDSVLKDPNNRIDPQKYKDFLIINESTTAPSNRSLTSYINFTFKLNSRHTLFIEYKKFGTSFVSFGNPFIRADQKSWDLQDRFTFFKRVISGNIRYQYLENNLNRTSFSTLTTNMYSGLITISPGKKWPVLFGTYMLQDRKNTPIKGESSIYFINNDNIVTYTAGINYRLAVGKIAHDLNLNGVQSQRKDRINTLNNNTNRVFSANLQQNFYEKLIISWLYSTTQLKLAGSSFNSLSSSYGATVQYRFVKAKLEAGIGYSANRMEASVYSATSTRPLMRLFATYKGIKKFTFNLEAATAPYTDTNNPNNNYNETYFYLKANYLLGN